MLATQKIFLGVPLSLGYLVPVKFILPEWQIMYCHQGSKTQSFLGSLWGAFL